MTNIKDKLSASVRHAKAGQQTSAIAPASAKPAASKPPATQPAAAKAATSKPTVTKPAASKPTAAPAIKAKQTTWTAPAVSADVPQSSSALFPARVWPD